MLVAFSATPAVAHWAGFSDVQERSASLGTNNYICAATGCPNHSYSYVSTQASTGSTCGRIYNIYSPDKLWEGTCGTGLVRFCASGSAHDGGGLNCHDDDANSGLGVRGYNASSGTRTVTVRGGY